MAADRLPRLYYIEFLGLACSGKSVLARRLATSLRAAGVPVNHSPSVSSFRLILALARRPGLALRWWRLASANIPTTTQKLRIFRRICALVATLVYHSGDDTVLIVDEGFLHLQRSLRRAAGDDGLTLERVFSRILPGNLIPVMPAHVVLVEITADTFVKRARSRDNRAVTAATACEAVERVKLSVEDADALTRRQKEVRFHRYKNETSDDAESIVGHLTDEILRGWNDRIN